MFNRLYIKHIQISQKYMYAADKSNIIKNVTDPLSMFSIISLKTFNNVVSVL